MSPPGLKAVQYATGEEKRKITNIPRMNELTDPKQIRPSVVNVSGKDSKIRCCIEQYCIGTWKVMSMNQGKLDVVKQ